MWKKLEKILRRFHGKMHKWKEKKKKQWKYWKFLNFPLGKKVYIIGTPLHSNIGDSAIVLAEKFFLKKCGYKESQIKELTFNEVEENRALITKYIGANGNAIVCWHGGGNLGNQWIEEEYFRRKIMSDLAKNRMIIFPQTIYYTDTEEGRLEEKTSIPFYNKEYGLTMIAREKKSYEIMSRLYPKTRILLTPDIVLSTTTKDYNVKNNVRKDVLLCFRSDVEKALSENDEILVCELVKKMGYQCQKTDMHTKNIITKENRIECVRDKMQEFANTKLVITDRLHGMIFAIITGTPCIVFDNYNHKIRGTYEWIKDLTYIQHVSSIEEVEKIFPELIDMKNCKYEENYLKKQFELIQSCINGYIQ